MAKLMLCDYILFIILITENLNLINSLSYNPVCWLMECCNTDYIPGDVKNLRATLKERVYGQHLIEEAVDAISGHWNPHHKSEKALTLSFHGWPGSGKNYVANFIAESLYKEGMHSKFVHNFIGRIHFPEQRKTQQYKEDLYLWLKSNMSTCPKQLFIFDEVDKMPADVLNAVKPMIDYRTVVDGVDYTKAVFIFLSNTGASLINQQYYQFWQSGKRREELKLCDFENLIAKGVFNEPGGFHHSDTIQSNLIDHYIPFFPMEEKHVKECIKDQFRERYVYQPKDKHIEEVMDFIEWGPNDTKLFSKTGCKRISSKVALLVARHYPNAHKPEL